MIFAPASFVFLVCEVRSLFDHWEIEDDVNMMSSSSALLPWEWLGMYDVIKHSLPLLTPSTCPRLPLETTNCHHEIFGCCFRGCYLRHGCVRPSPPLECPGWSHQRHIQWKYDSVLLRQERIRRDDDACNKEFPNTHVCTDAELGIIAQTDSLYQGNYRYIDMSIAHNGNYVVCLQADNPSPPSIIAELEYSHNYRLLFSH